MAQKVEAVKETVSSVKDTLEESFAQAKETVQKGIGAVKDVLDVTGHVRRHPWPMFGGSVAAGFALGTVVVKLKNGTLGGGASRFTSGSWTGSMFSGLASKLRRSSRN